MGTTFVSKIIKSGTDFNDNETRLRKKQSVGYVNLVHL
jgi:hypothetical protein